MIDEDMLRAMMPNAGRRLDAHLPYIGPAMEEGEINTPERESAFLAQLAHESGEYQYMEEIWGPTSQQLGYEGRADLGNTEPGDGKKFKGHGPIQITGRANHKACGNGLGLDLTAHPELIAMPENGTRSAVWFWNTHHLSLLADRGWFKAITRIINGGYTHLDERIEYYQRNRALLGLPPYDQDGEDDAIKGFQATHGLVADGSIGPRTMKALGA